MATQIVGTSAGKRNTDEARDWRLWVEKRDEHAKERLFHRYQNLVFRTIGHVLPKGVPPRLDAEDLAQEGRIALLRAVEKFDPRRGVKFRSFAISMIRGALLEYLRTDDWATRTIREWQRQVSAARDRARTRKNGAEPTDAEVAVVLGMTLDGYYQRASECVLHETYSIEEIVTDYDDPEPVTRLETLCASDNPERDVLRAAACAELWREVGFLPPAEAETLTLYYGEGLLIREVAARCRKSQSRIQQRHGNGLAALRQRLPLEAVA